MTAIRQLRRMFSRVRAETRGGVLVASGDESRLSTNQLWNCGPVEGNHSSPHALKNAAREGDEP